MNKNTEKIYKNVFRYLKINSYFEDLQNKLSLPEKDRFNKKQIFKYGLDISDAVHCVYDKNRSYKLMNCIQKKVKTGDLVLEAGSGTGILSFMAVYSGAKVLSIEINENIMNLFKSIYSFLVSNKILYNGRILFKKNDAIKFKTKEKFNMIISENLYTGMFYEKQVDIMNNLISYLKKGGVAVPSKFEMGIILTETIFPYKPKKMEMFVVLEHKQKKDLKYKELSRPQAYHILDFSKKNDKSINNEIRVRVTKSGKINSILIWSKVLLPDGNVIGRSDTIFLNNDIILAQDKSIDVEKGDIIKLDINYKFGCKPDQAQFLLIK